MKLREFVFILLVGFATCIFVITATGGTTSSDNNKAMETSAEAASGLLAVRPDPRFRDLPRMLMSQNQTAAIEAGLELNAATAASPGWSLTGSLNVGRIGHTATLLPNGRVLVVGGWSDGEGMFGYSVSYSELYDPATGTWSYAGSPGGRQEHTATVLKDGRVLVVGGLYTDELSYYDLSECVIYDPASGTWSYTGSLHTARVGHTATLLQDGRVLVVGGYPGGASAGSEIYDPTTGTWSTTSSMHTARQAHTATLLPNGRILVTGGGVGEDLADSEIYDPASDTWSTTGSLQTARMHHTATLLPDGRVLVSGGENSDILLADCEIYNPQTGTWTSTGSMNAARWNHVATLLADGRVLVVSLEDSMLCGSETYDPASGVWSNTGYMNTARLWHTATLLADGRVLVTGGTGANGLVAQCELYSNKSGSWAGTGSMSHERYGHTATLLLNGRVLVSGGFNSSSGPLSTCEIHDPASGTWSNTGSMNTPRVWHKATLLPDGRVLVSGGYNYDNGWPSLSGCEIYDPASGTWSNTGSMNTAREEHSATLLPDGRVLVSGGYNYDNGWHSLSGCEIYDPASGTWSNTGSMNTPRVWHKATLLPDGRVLVSGGYNWVEAELSGCEIYDPASGTWSNTGPMNTPRHPHKATLLPDGRVLVSGGVAGASFFAQCELYDAEQDIEESWRPVVTGAFMDQGSVSLSGSGFRGLSEGSFGSTQQSAANFPLVQIRRLDNDQLMWLLPGEAWTDGSYSSLPLTNFPDGPALVTVFVNGIPSMSKFIFTPGDGDNDAMLDYWEITHFGSLSRDGVLDKDSDGLTDLQEYQNQTDPTREDTDGDGYSDYQEVQAGSNPNDPNEKPNGALTVTILPPAAAKAGAKWRLQGTTIWHNSGETLSGLAAG